MPWKPRASKGGLYSSCSYAAWLDKAIHEGLIPEPADGEWSSSPYADLGTLIHDALQRRLGCVMQTRLEAGLDSLRTNAAALFKTSDELLQAIGSSVEFAASIFPPAPDGKPWLAEPDGELPNLTGHLDFESQDGAEIIDLKTTARKPDGCRMKPLHLAQIVGYWDLRGRKAKSARILYVDSLRGSWAIMTAPVLFNNPFVVEYADKLSALRTEQMGASCAPMPVPGDHCKSGFCNYRNSSVCYSQLIPLGEASQVYENKAKAKPSEFQGPKTTGVKLW